MRIDCLLDLGAIVGAATSETSASAIYEESTHARSFYGVEMYDGDDADSDQDSGAMHAAR